MTLYVQVLGNQYSRVQAEFDFSDKCIPCHFLPKERQSHFRHTGFESFSPKQML